jgi:hypothetical protein
VDPETDDAVREELVIENAINRNLNAAVNLARCAYRETESSTGAVAGEADRGPSASLKGKAA